MKKVKVGIIGCGRATEVIHIPNYLNCKDAEVVALVDKDKKQLQKTAKKLKVKNTFSDYKKMLNNVELDMVDIVLPNHLHYKVATDCLKAKKHVLIEKPIALKLNDAKKMCALAKKVKKFLMVEQTQRFEPMHEKAKEIIDSGKLGKIYMIKVRIGHIGPEAWNPNAKWFFQKDKVGGGCMLDGGAHVIDLILWLTGKRIKEVSSVLTTVEKHSKLEDNSVCIMKFTDNTLGMVEASWTTRPDEFNISIYGSKAKITTAAKEGIPLAVHMPKPSNKNLTQKVLKPRIPKESKRISPIHYFVKCVKDNKKPFITPQDGVRALEIILAAYKSEKLKKRIKV
jgi:predicted dehydrogenase